MICLPQGSTFVRALLTSLLIFAAAGAQGKPPAGVEPEEEAALALGARELAAYAAQCAKSGFGKRAREIWLEVIGEYDPDHEAAREATGFVRHGKVWQFDLDYEFPVQDELDAKAARALQKRFDALCRKLGHAHREAAEALTAAGKEERAVYHIQRALRFLPEDRKVIAASGMAQFEGVAGSATDLEILRRSQEMTEEVARLLPWSCPTQEVATRPAAVERAGLTVAGVSSEHFVVHGDWDPGVLAEAAVWSERALRFCEAAFAGHLKPSGRSRTRRAFVYLREKPTWVRLLEANVRTLGREQVAFAAEHASASMIGELHTAGVEQVETVYDLAVRWVVQDYAGLGSDAMNEGIGHAVVGMFFGRNLVFSVGREDPRGTVSSRQRARLQLPDMDTWMELATEVAWSRTSTRAARLPLLRAASFPTDGRIKAWSFCDYLLRRDPKLLRVLDATAAKARGEADVEQLFEKAAGVPLAALERGWRRFWTEDSAISRRVLARGPSLEAASKDAPKWLDAINAARQAAQGKPVGWSARLSVDCRQHADYLRSNRDQRGPLAEHTQLAGRPGFSHAGRSFAQTAVVSTRDKDPTKAVARWMLIPGYRDVLLNRNIDTVGLYVERDIAVLDGRRGRAASNQVVNITFPYADQAGGRRKDPVPAAVPVELLGPEVEALLSDHGRGKQKEIGLPLSAHFYFGPSDGVQCAVTARGKPVAGWLVRGAGSCGRTSAPGLWVFYPAEPLEKGVDITARWTWPGGGHTVTFVAK